MERHKYYSTQRPVDIGTFPKPAGNYPIEFVNFEKRMWVEDGAFMAWGYLIYRYPLTVKEMMDYELRLPEPKIKNPTPKAKDRKQKTSPDLDR